MKKRFVRDYSEILANDNRILNERIKPVSVKSIMDEQPLTVLEKLVKMWASHDVRYKGYESLDDPLMFDMVKSAEQRITRKDIANGILEISIEMVRNLDEIERYNAAAAQHNKKWMDNGSPTDIFDPVHGDSYAVKDQYLDPVMMQSKHYDLPKSAYKNVSSGKLASRRPEINRKSHLRVRYQLHIRENRFVLGYAAYDYEDRIIYYNEYTHQDLAYLVRRSVQEIWGNHECSDEFGPLLEGVRMLINGKKLIICKKDNKFPEFLSQEKTELKSTKPIRLLEEQEKRQIAASNTCAFYMPIVFIIGFVVCLFWTFGVMAGEDITLYMLSYGSSNRFLILAVEVLIKPPMLGCILLLVCTVICRKFAQDAERNASEIVARKKLM